MRIVDWFHAFATSPIANTILATVTFLYAMILGFENRYRAQALVSGITLERIDVIKERVWVVIFTLAMLSSLLYIGYNEHILDTLFLKIVVGATFAFFVMLVTSYVLGSKSANWRRAFLGSIIVIVAGYDSFLLHQIGLYIALLIILTITGAVTYFLRKHIQKVVEFKEQHWLLFLVLAAVWPTIQLTLLLAKFGSWVWGVIQAS